jgi:hypothetical protein
MKRKGKEELEEGEQGLSIHPSVCSLTEQTKIETVTALEV